MTEHHRDRDPTPAVWSCFVLLQRAAEQGREVDADENRYLAETAFELGPGAWLEGWSTVSALLRKGLREHAEEVGCSCGSDEWLGQVQYRLAQTTLDERADRRRTKGE